MNVVVCGTGFGRYYVDAIRAMRDCDLIGIMARGGDFSRRYAGKLGVPCYTSVGQLPRNVDLACVVVGSAVSCGPGSDLARQLLTRKIPVLQEHPVLPDELAETMRVAAAHGVRYRLNAFYRHLEPIRRFLAAAELLRPARFVDAVTPIQLLYPLLDLLGRALGGFRPWSLTAFPAAEGPYRLMHGTLASVPITLRVQNQLHPGDPDNHALQWHRITVGAETGTLTLADTHGPVLWTTRLHAPRDTDHRLRHTGPGTGHLDLPATAILPGSRPPGSLREIFTRLWPSGIAAAITEFSTPATALAEARHDLAASRVWQEVTERLGRPELIIPDPPHPFDLMALL